MIEILDMAKNRSSKNKLVIECDDKIKKGLPS